MKAIRLRFLIGLSLACLPLAGCVAPKLASSAAPEGARLLISLPRQLIGKEEGILSLKLEFANAWVVAVRKIPMDWDFETHWEDGGHVTASGLARHFSARVTDVRALDDFLLIEVERERSREPTDSFAVQATVELGVSDPQGGTQRTVKLSRTDLVIRPAPAGAR